MIVKLAKSHILEFYAWVLDEQAWNERIDMEGWPEAKFRDAIAHWQQRAEDDYAILRLNFRNDADAVAFKLRYPDAIYR